MAKPAKSAEPDARSKSGSNPERNSGRGSEPGPGPASGPDSGRRRGPAAASAPFPLVTLKRRAEFLRVRKGARCAVPAFVLEGRVRARLPEGQDAQARFGFTLTRQVGNAVVRNRIRRRLKAAVAGAGPHARSDFDYVLIARRAALTLPFSTLVADLIDALDRIDRAVAQEGRRRENRNRQGW